MSFSNVQRPKLEIIKNWGNRNRTWNVLDYLLRTSNANSLIDLDDQQFLADPGAQPGKLRTARIAYVPLDCGDDAACGAGLCSTGTPIAPVVRDFAITQCSATATRSLAQSNIRLTDSGEWDINSYALEMIGAQLPKFREQIARDMLTYVYTKAGVHADGSASKRIPLVTNQTNGTVTPTGMWAVEQEYRDAGFDMPYILGGGTEFYNYRKSIDIGGLDQNGMLINRLPNDNLWYDDGLQRSLFNSTSAGEWVLGIDPQMFKLVFYHANVGQFSTDLKGINNINQLFKGSSGPGHDFVLSTMQDPASGLVFDFFANFDKCTLAWHWHLEVHWDMFVMPDINCGPTGFNGITIWRTCPQIEIACPAGSPIASPAAATTYNWNPSFTYPQTFYQATIGGVTATFPDGVTVANDTEFVAFLNDVMGSTVFTLVGSNVRYTGYSAYSVSLNDGAITGTFA